MGLEVQFCATMTIFLSPIWYDSKKVNKNVERADGDEQARNQPNSENDVERRPEK